MIRKIFLSGFLTLALAAQLRATLTLNWANTQFSDPNQRNVMIPAGSSQATLVPAVQATGAQGYTVPVTVYKDGSVFSTGNMFAGGSPVYVTGNQKLVFYATASDSATSFTLPPVTMRIYREDHVAPSAPGSLSVSNLQATGFTINWTASTDNELVDYYEVWLDNNYYWTVSSGASLTLPITSTVYNGTIGLNPGQTYNVTIKAYDWAGNTASSSIPVTTPAPDTTPPTTPGAISFSNVSSTGATATWGASTDNVAVASYEVKLYDPMDNWISTQTINHPATTCSISNLQANTAYHITVVAKDTSGNPSSGQPGSFTTNATGLPPGVGTTVFFPYPSNLAASGVNENSFTLTWTPTIDASTVSYYQVELNGALLSVPSGQELSLSKFVGSLAANTVYTLRVVAVKSGGATAWSPSLQVKTSTPLVALSANITRPSGSGEIVGAAGAGLSVDNHGSANYSIPLQIAPGRSGLQPSLALGYSSGGGGGVIGLGWSISTGFPQAISRGRTILARDGVVKGVNFDDTAPTQVYRDKFYLDGKRLICVSGNYGEAGSTYRTEVDSFVTVTAIGASTTIDTFTVTDKSGTTMTFGQYAGSLDGYQTGVGGTNSLAYTYALKRVADALGNYVAFTYQDLGGGEFVLSRLDYTGGASISPAASVEFAYEARDDQATTYVAGRSFKHRARLAVITAKNGSTTTAAYGLNYDYAPNGLGASTTYSGRSRLRSVTPFVADPQTLALQSLRATTIDWIDPQLAFATSPTTPASDPGSVVDSDAAISWVDQNLDGKNEWLAVPSNTVSALNLTYTMTGDLDSDGKNEKFTVNYLGLSGTLTSTGATVSINFGTIFYDPPPANTLLLADLEGAGITSRIIVADFTGDGRADVLAHGYDGYLYLFESTGSGFLPAVKSQYPAGAPNTVLSDDKSFYRSQLQIVPYIGQHYFIHPIPCDLNGDGRTDYVFTQNTRAYNRYGGTVYSYTDVRSTVGVLSLPGGGFSKAFTVNPNLPTYVADSKPMNFADAYTGVITGDFNGDGLTDFLCLDNKNSNRWLMLINKGENRPSGSSDPTDVSVTFEWVFGAIPNTVTVGGESLDTYYKAVTDARWNQIKTPVSNVCGITYGSLVGALESASGSLSAFVRDINGDGLDDYVWYVALNSADGTTTNKGWYAMLSTGNFSAATPASGFVGPVRISAFDAIDGGQPCTTSTGPLFTSLSVSGGMDTDGDGQQDYFFRGASNGKPVSTVTTSNLKQPRAANGSSPAPFAGLVSAITDGLGRRTVVGYKAAKDDAVYTPGAAVSYPIRDMRASTPVVSDVWHDSGSSATAQFSYQYSGNRMDFSGRGGLGFHSFITLDRQTGLFKYQFLAQSFPMTGLTHREETYRWWNTGGQDKFRFISSHDNTVVFDKVATGAGATLWPFISRAIEYRWEDSTTEHFSFSAAAVNSQPENLFVQAKPAGYHILITAQSLFDNQGGTQLTLPGVSGYNPSDFNGSANTATGTTTFATFSGLPGNITYGNLKQLSTDFGGGFTETVTTTYKSPVGALTGLVDTVSTSVASPGYGTEAAPVKSYTYFGSTPLVATETTDATGTNLDLTTTYTRDSLGRVTNTQISSPDSAIGTYTVSSASAFDARWDQPTTTQNNYGHTTTTAYQAFLGVPTSVTDVNGAQVTTSYDALGRATTVTDVLKGLTTTTTYAFDNTQVVSAPGSVTLTSAYKITVVTNPTGNNSIYLKPPVTTWYDRLGRAIRSIKDGFNGQQVVADTGYNVLGQVVASSLPYPSGGTPLWTTTTYDALGRVSQATAPNGTITTNTYIGRATQVSVDAPNLGGVDPAAQVNTTLVDFKGRTVSVWNADNVPAFSDNVGTTGTAPSISFALDGFGRMRATTLKGQSQPITATYDALGRQIQLADPDKGTWNYVNNALGQVVIQTDASGNTTASTFDKLGRPLSRTTTGNGSTETANFYYYDTDASKPNTVAKGAKGWIGAPEREEANVTGSYPTVNLHYYDALGRPSLELAQTDGKWFYTATSYREPDGNDYSRVTQVRHYWKPSGAEAPGTQPYVWQDYGYVYAYDSKSYLLSLTDTLGRSWWDTPTYDYMDRVISVRKGSGYTTTRSYRAEDGVLTGITTSGLQAMAFNFDGLGNLTSRSDTGVSESFTYDNLNRLTSSSIGGTINYFDNGNIQSKTGVDGTASGTYTYDGSRPHAVATAFGYGMTYDGNGNLLTRTKGAESWSMKWTGFDKPRWMMKNGVGSEFHYNAARSRVMQLEFDQATGTAPNQVPSRYVRKRTYALGSTLELNYVAATPSASPTWNLDTVRIYVPGPDGIIGAREFHVTSGSVGTEKALVYHYDHLGSITAITDWGTTNLSNDSGGKPGKFSEDAWGQRRNPFTWSGAPVMTGGNKSDDGSFDSLTPRGFTGHEMLDDLGLVHMNGRIYDPLLGRFLSADTVVQFPGSLQSYNRYSYVENNPLTRLDPTGWYSIMGLEFTNGGGVGGFFKDLGGYGGNVVMGAVGDNMVEGYHKGTEHMAAGMTEIANANGALDATIGGLHMVAGISTAVSVVMDVTPEGKAEKLATEGVEKLATKAESAVTHAVEKAEAKATTIEKRVEGVVAEDGAKVSKEAPTGQFRDENGRLRNSDGKFAPDGGSKAKSSNSTHGNTAGDQEAVLYEKYDKDGNFEKHGITQDLDTRYSKKELAGGELVEKDRGPRREMLKKERERVETNPGPKNHEPWAGKRKKLNESD